MRARISSSRHAHVLEPSLIGLGKRPAFMPAHQLLLDIGISSRTALSRNRPSKSDDFRFNTVRILLSLVTEYLTWTMLDSAGLAWIPATIGGRTSCRRRC